MSIVAQATGGALAANDPPDAPAIELDQVDLSRQGLPVLEQVSFSLPPGGSLVITGSNGAGKTTLLEALVEGRRSDAGSLRLFGRDAADPMARRRLAWLPERVLAPAAAPGHEVLAGLGGRYGMRWSPAEARLLGRSHGLADEQLDRCVSGYSPGMLKALGLIAALASDRALLVLDEPFAGLDGSAREWWLGRLLRLRQEQRTLLVAARSLAGFGSQLDRVLLLGHGRVLFEGTPASLQARCAGGAVPA